MKPGLILVHIPKTGGSSLATAIRRHYRFSNFNVNAARSAAVAEYLRPGAGRAPFLVERQHVRSTLVIYNALRGKRFVTGHVWYEPAMSELGNRGYSLVTMLRDPVRRWYSEYFYSRYKSSPHARIDDDIEAVLAGEKGREMGQTYLRYLSGRLAQNEPVEERLRLAGAHLARFQHVGLLEAVADTEAWLSDFLGKRVRLPHKRKSPAHRADWKRIEQSQEIRRAVEALCGHDIELYEQARALRGA